MLMPVPRDSCKLKRQMANAEWRLELKRGMDGTLEAELQRKSSEAVPRCIGCILICVYASLQTH